MRKILASIAAISLFITAVTAQEDYKRPAALGISFVLNDYATAAKIRSSSLSSVLANGQWSKLGDMSPGAAVTYFKGLTNHIDFASTLAGTFVKNALPNNSSVNEKFSLEADASLNFKLVSDAYYFTPYAIAGVGAQKIGSSFGAFIPVGLGFKINLGDEVQIFSTGQYRLPATTQSAKHRFFYQIGIAGTIGKKKEKVLPPPPPLPPADTDKDGIIDSLDKCPTEAGLEKYQGCPVPDTDKDGINDEEDKCPNEAGLARYAGCPIPDTDKDGINDEEDKCINEAGPVSNNGCPFVDTDGDGIVDPEDKCPTLAGVKENNGCPVVTEELAKKVNYAAQNIYFATGKYVLLSKSNKGLNEVAQIMKDNPDMRLVIDGHTDNVGADDFNQTLSDNRANAVKSYLVKKGVDESHLIATGYGETQPVADNKTAAGRQKNRRVELKLNYY